MSVNRRGRNKGATRRAYLKVIQGGKGNKFDKNPDDLIKAAIGIGRNISSTQPVITRNGIAYPIFNGKTGKLEWRWSPNMTKPMRERVDSWHTHIKERPSEYHCVLVNTPLRKVSLYFTGFSERETYWFKWYDPILKSERESITYGAKPIAMRHFKLGTIQWK